MIMILSSGKILELNKKYNLLENLSERETSNPEGVGIDIRVGEVYRLEGEGYLGETERKTPEAKKIADIKNGDKFFVLKPGELVLIKTIERINVPAEKISIEEGSESRHLMAHPYPRTTLQRSGVFFRGCWTPKRQRR